MIDGIPGNVVQRLVCGACLGRLEIVTAPRGLLKPILARALMVQEPIGDMYVGACSVPHVRHETRREPTRTRRPGSADLAPTVDGPEGVLDVGNDGKVQVQAEQLQLAVEPCPLPPERHGLPNVDARASRRQP